MLNLLIRLQDLLTTTFRFEFIAPLLLRLYLVPVFYMAGEQKIHNFDSTVEWFGNEDWGLGLPLPWLLAMLAAWTEYLGAILLAVGFATRWICIPLSITMIVAMATVHWQNGWLAIAAGSGPFASERTIEAIDRLDRAKSILQEYGNYTWLTEKGSIVILNNGIEFGATYLLLLIALFFLGAGKYVSVDYWIDQRLRQRA